MYAFLDKREDPGVLVFRFEDPDAAPPALDGSGVGTIPSVALFERRMGRPGPFSAAALRYGDSPASRASVSDGFKRIFPGPDPDLGGVHRLPDEHPLAPQRAEPALDGRGRPRVRDRCSWP